MPVSLEIGSLRIIRSVETIASALREQFASRMEQLTHDDPEVDHVEWSIYEFVSWEAGWSGQMDLPGLFVTVSTRQLHVTETNTVHRGGPDVNVGFCFRCHRDRLGAAHRLGAYVCEALWAIAEGMEYAPHVHSLSSFGKPESTDWGINGAVLFGPVQGAPEGIPFS